MLAADISGLIDLQTLNIQTFADINEVNVEMIVALLIFVDTEAGATGCKVAGQYVTDKLYLFERGCPLRIDTFKEGHQLFDCFGYVFSYIPIIIVVVTADNGKLEMFLTVSFRYCVILY